MNSLFAFRNLAATAALLMAMLPFASFAAQAQTYNQWDRTQTLLRNVSFVDSAVIRPTATGTRFVLEVKEAVNTFNGIQLRHRSYNGGLCGPVIRVRPGTSLNIRLENHLPPESAVPSHDPNDPHGFNTTNLHTHGLHVSPRPPADDVFLEIGPGSTFEFSFQIPPDHPAGTFWYHAHKHGSTALQLASGMAGALIVEGGLDDVPEIRAAEEKILLLQQFVYREVAGAEAQVIPQDVYEQLVVPQVAVNGQVTPTIVMRPGEVQRWRIIHAGISEAILLSLDGIPLHEIAIDGLALGTRIERSSIELYPGYRSDVLVKAPLEEETYLMTTEIQNPRQSLRGRVVGASDVLKVVVAGSPIDMPLPQCDALAAYAAFDDDDVPSDSDISSTTEFKLSAASKPFLINGEPFEPGTTKRTMTLDTAEEWYINSKAGGHPFHVHVNPFAVRMPEADGNPARWVWRDTIFVPHGETIAIRSWFRTFTGKTVLHCHILDHEDQGMMQAIEIVSPDASKQGTHPESQIEAMPILRRMTNPGPEVASIAFDNSLHLLVLHRGFACAHCAEQVSLLVERHHDFESIGLSLIAVSPALPDGTDYDANIDRTNSRFPLVADPELELFRKLGCISPEGRPMHGVFLISASGEILWQVVGQQAETDIDQMLAQLREAIVKRTTSD